MSTFASARRAGSCPRGIAATRDTSDARVLARATRAWAALALLASLQLGCATRSAAPEPQTAPAPPQEPAPLEEPASLEEPTPLEEPATIAVPPACPPCAQLRAENARLRTTLGEQEAELRELRARQHAQVIALEQQTRQAAQATTRLERLATRADAASSIAEVEVAIAGARSTAGLADDDARLAVAQGYLASSRRTFERGEYGAAIGLASRAAGLIAAASGTAMRPAASHRTSAIAAFHPPVPMRVTIDSHLRHGPSARATARGVLRAGSTLLAVGRSGRWLRVEVGDGRAGWVYEPLLEPLLGSP